MSYTKRTDIPCESAETVVQLDDTSALVAVQCGAERAMSNQVVFTPAARWIDATGVTKADGAGRNVAVVKSLSLSPEDVTRLTATAVVKECLLLVLGEPLTPDPADPSITLIPWSPALVAQCSIRNAIASASVTAPDAGEVL